VNSDPGSANSVPPKRGVRVWTSTKQMIDVVKRPSRPLVTEAHVAQVGVACHVADFRGDEDTMVAEALSSLAAGDQRRRVVLAVVLTSAPKLDFHPASSSLSPAGNLIDVARRRDDVTPICRRGRLEFLRYRPEAS